MSTLNYDEIPRYTKDYIASATLRAIRRFAQTDEGKALKEKLDNKEDTKNGKEQT